MKKNTFAIPVLALTLLAGGFYMTPSAQAENVDTGKQTQQQKRAQFTDAQKAEAHKLIEASRDKMSPVRDSLYVKQQELKALQNATNPDVQAVAKTAQEITQLRGKMQSERQTLGLALDKALGLPAGTHAMKKYRFGKHGVAFHGGGKGQGRKHGRHMDKGKGRDGRRGHDDRQGSGHNRDMMGHM